MWNIYIIMLSENRLIPSGQGQISIVSDNISYQSSHRNYTDHAGWH